MEEEEEEGEKNEALWKAGLKKESDLVEFDISKSFTFFFQ